MPALWNQQTPLHPTFDAIHRCLTDDWFLLPYELRLQRAHAVALSKCGILTAEEFAEIDRGLEAIGRTYGGRDVPASDAEDLHTWLEQALVERVGDAGRKIHTARSRNDQVATLLVMYVIDAGRQLAGDLQNLAALFCRRAKDWSKLIFPLHTHTQFAAPGVVGFWVLRYAMSLDRVRRHVRPLVGLWREACPLGSGAACGSSIAVDRNVQASELGFAGPSANALASTSCRDEALEYLAIAAQVALHLQSLAADVILFSQTPLGWTRYPAAFATGSSMMPNKSNPDAMELLRGEGARVAASHTQALLLLKGLPSGYHRDLQCIKPLVRDTAEALNRLLALTAAFVEALEFDAEKMKASLRLGNIDATLRMEQRVKNGTPLREAHHAVAEEAASRPAADVDGRRLVEQYQTIGSAGPRQTRQAADDLLAALQKERGDW